MPLTPTDVANKQFRIAFRGYSLDEVDAFLDEVETELTRLLRDNAALKERASGPAAQPLAAADAPAAEPVAAPAPLAGMEGQEAALRTLLLAQRTADEAIAEARAEAEQIVSAAREEADQTLSAARAEAEATLSKARAEADETLSTSQQKAAQVDQEVAARIQAATGNLDVRRRELEGRIEELRAFEREYRTRLKAYLESQLRDLESGTAPDDSGAGVPAGARSAAVAGSKGARTAVPAVAPAAGEAPDADADADGETVDEPDTSDAAEAADATVEADDDAPDGPPREAEGSSPSGLRAVPPLTSKSPHVGPFTVVRPAEADPDSSSEH